MKNTHIQRSEQGASGSVARSLAHQEGASIFQFVDQRPESAACRGIQRLMRGSPQVAQLQAYQRMANSGFQGKRQETQAPPQNPVVQRVILLDSTEIEWGFIVGARSMKKQHPTESINLLQKVNLAALPDGEPIRLVAHGHGDDGKFGGRTAAELAAALNGAGLKLTAGAIHLMSCNSGVGGANSYAATLAKQFKEIFTVTGYQGIAATDLEGETVSFNPTDDHVARYQAINLKYQAQVTAANALAAAARTEMLVVGADVEAIVIAASANIEALTNALTLELVALNNEILLTRRAARYSHDAKNFPYGRLSAKAKGHYDRIEEEKTFQKDLGADNVRLEAEIRVAGEALNRSNGSDEAFDRLNNLEALVAGNEALIEGSKIKEEAEEADFIREAKMPSSKIVKL